VRGKQVGEGREEGQLGRSGKEEDRERQRERERERERKRGRRTNLENIDGLLWLVVRLKNNGLDQKLQTLSGLLPLLGDLRL